MPVTIVTGAGRGIGRAVAVALGAEGGTVCLVARSEADLEETRALVAATGAAAAVAVADVRDAAAVERAVDAARSHGDVTAIVNNAGTMRAIGPVWEVDPGDWRTDLETSILGAFNLCRAVLPAMITQGGGRVVNLVSYAGARPSPYQTAYACAKAGLINLTESLAASLAPHGGAAFAVAPGFTDTELTRTLVDSDAGRQWLPDVGGGRVVEADDTAALVARLVKGDADELSGRVLHTLDDVDELLAHLDVLRADELYVPRIRRLPGS